MSVDRRWEPEAPLIATVPPPRSKTTGDDSYEPFSDPDVMFEVTKWPAKKPVPTAVRRWDDKTSAPAGTVQGDTKAKGGQ